MNSLDFSNVLNAAMINIFDNQLALPIASAKNVDGLFSGVLRGGRQIVETSPLLFHKSVVLL